MITCQCYIVILYHKVSGLRVVGYIFGRLLSSHGRKKYRAARPRFNSSLAWELCLRGVATLSTVIVVVDKLNHGCHLEKACLVINYADKKKIKKLVNVSYVNKRLNNDRFVDEAKVCQCHVGICNHMRKK